MRFADGPNTEAELVIDASPADVWDVITDITLPTEPSDELQSVEWIEPSTHAELGARFRGHMDNSKFEWATESEITEFDPPSRFAWTVDPMTPGAGAVATWGFELTPSGDNATLLRQFVTLGPGPSGLTMAIEKYPEREESIIEARLAQQRAAMERNLQAVQAQLGGNQ